jgi:Fe-S-cluster-containing dehydrogenase component
MSLDRRTFLKGLGTTAAAAAAGTSTALAVRPKAPAADSVGLLYDATRCIGCKACMVACREVNQLPPERDKTGLYDAPIDLSGGTKTVIRLYREGEQTAYSRAACMHCVDPACVSVCMFGALHKQDNGIVAYALDRCIGCRYCQVACPFNVPAFEWDSATPKIVKCEMCRERVAEGRLPGCAGACPREALVFGRRDELLQEAHRRLAEQPGKYVPKVYGESDAGGTQVLMLSHVAFEKLGLPALGDDSVPALSETIQHSIYQGMALPIGLYALLAVVMLRNRRGEAKSEEEQP